MNRIPNHELFLLIALAVAGGLPTPRTLSISDEHGVVYLTLSTIDGALRWAEHLGANVAEVTVRVDESSMERRLHNGCDMWRGWSLGLYASEPLPQPLTSDTADRVRAAAAVTV